MNIRIATIEEFKQLWNYSQSNTYKYFLSLLEKDTIEFWTVEVHNQLIGELYIFWDSIDKDEANGSTRAYLCAYRIHKDYQQQGYGSKLMTRVIKRVKEKGYSEVTIGIDNDDYNRLSSMYAHYGFDQFVKQKSVDHHYIDQEGNPQVLEEPYQLMMAYLD